MLAGRSAAAAMSRSGSRGDSRVKLSRIAVILEITPFRSVECFASDGMRVTVRSDLPHCQQWRCINLLSRSIQGKDDSYGIANSL